MTLDKVLTVAIGRNGADGTPLSSRKWRQFRQETLLLIEHEGIVVSNVSGRGIGSDDVNEGVAEDTAIIVAINPTDVRRIRRGMAAILLKYGQGSAAFALDRSHRPVFATSNGNRA